VKITKFTSDQVPALPGVWRRGLHHTLDYPKALAETKDMLPYLKSAEIQFLRA
jgi:hypothetical protein